VKKERKKRKTKEAKYIRPNGNPRGRIIIFSCICQVDEASFAANERTQRCGQIIVCRFLMNIINQTLNNFKHFGNWQTQTR